MRHFFLFNSFLFLLFLSLILLIHCQQNLPESWPNPSLLGKKCYCQSPFAYFLASCFISALLTNPFFTILASWILSAISSFYPVFSPNLLSVFAQLKQNTDVWQDVNNTLCLRHVDVRTWNGPWISSRVWDSCSPQLVEVFNSVHFHRSMWSPPIDRGGLDSFGSTRLLDPTHWAFRDDWWRGLLFSCQAVSNYCNPMDCSPPGSSVHGILQARILEWIAISSSRGSSQPKDGTWVFCIGRWILYHWASGEAHDEENTHC